MSVTPRAKAPPRAKALHEKHSALTTKHASDAEGEECAFGIHGRRGGEDEGV